MAGVKPLLETVGALLPRIKAWHASPHDFDKFDLSKIGTGQGAASYGPGIYAAESPAVSGVGGEYWKEFSRGMQRGAGAEQSHAIDIMQKHQGDRAAALADVEKALTGTTNYPRAHMERVRDLLASDKQVGPRVYELDIKADPQSFLQWDEPLKNQMHNVEKMPHLLDLAKEEAHSRVLSSSNQSRRNQLYDMISHPTEATGEFAFRSGAPDKTMNQLRDAGIPGIRYADAASRNPVAPKAYQDAAKRLFAQHQDAIRRNAPMWEIEHLGEQSRLAQERITREVDNFPRTYNYVVNNPDIIEIMRKLAVPGMVGGAASVYQPQGQQ